VDAITDRPGRLRRFLNWLRGVAPWEPDSNDPDDWIEIEEMDVSPPDDSESLRGL